VVGASERPGSAGRLVLENLRNLGYRGAVYAVHPKYREVLGFSCYPDLNSLPGPVDSVAVLLAAEKALPTLGAAVEVGAQAAWVLASGFAEAGPDGKARQAELTQFAEETGLMVCGPNCIGVANLVDMVATYSVALSPATRAGGVSAVVQSGTICLGLANAARFDFRYLISSGNEAVLDSADYIGYLASDPHTRVITAFLEGIHSPQKFIAAAQATAEAGKPILLVKVGRSEVARRAVLCLPFFQAQSGRVGLLGPTNGGGRGTNGEREKRKQASSSVIHPAPSVFYGWLRTLPGKAPVCCFPSTTRTPLTKTRSIPSG